MEFPDGVTNLMQDKMNESNGVDIKSDYNEIQHSLYPSCGKTVRIVYVKTQDERNEKRYETQGVVVNIHPLFVYIINDRNCMEIFRVHDIRQMTQIGK